MTLPSGKSSQGAKKEAFPSESLFFCALGQDTTETVIDGGCHAGFGSYGAQKGDGAPTISAEEQQRQTADALAAWMNLQ